MKKLSTGLLYVSLHNQLIKNVGGDRTIDRKTFFCIVGKHFLVPKNLRAVVIKEMEEKGLVKQELSGKIKVLNCDIDLEEDVSKIYELAGLY